MNQHDMKYKKVLLIGIDGMDYSRSKEIMNELPNFKRLSDQGSFQKLQTTYPPESPVAWTTLATGVSPGKHGLYDFIVPMEDSYLPELSISKSVNGFSGTKYVSVIKAKAFWETTSKENIPTTVIRWPATFPPEKINGKMFSGLGVVDIKGYLGGYTLYTTDMTIKQKKSVNKIIYVDDSDYIETNIYGPKKQTPRGLEEVEEKLLIKIGDNNAVLELGGKSYELEQDRWSEFIRVKFDTGLIKKTAGIFRAYLVSLDPLKIYITTVQINPENPVVPISYPDNYARELSENIGLYFTLGMPEETDGYGDDVLPKKAFLEHIKEIEKERENMFWYEFEKFEKKEKGIFAFAFDSSDRLQHVAWYDDEVILDYYKIKDEFLGKVMDKMDNSTLLLLFSDHGFTDYNLSVNINSWLVKNGYMTLTRDIKNIDENSLFEYVDWDNTKAFSMGFASIYINEKGRFPQGTVENRDEVVEEIVKDLNNLSYENKKVIHNAYRKEDIYTGEMEGSPDIIVGFNRGYRMSWQSAIGGITEEIVFDNNEKWKADHLMDPKFVPGVLFSNKDLKDGARNRDIVPTVYEALGIEGQDTDGVSLLK